jgi:hypothetical protein
MLIPWILGMTPPASATPAADPVNPHSGRFSARIDISEPSTSPAGVSLQQQGLRIEAGANYVVSFAARSAAPRQIRVRVMNASGGTLGDGVAYESILPEWTVASFPMTSFGATDGAILAFDLGGDATTVWIDDVSFSRIPPGAP